MASKTPTPEMTGHKARYTLLTVLVANVVLALLGVIDADIETIKNDLTEALTLAAAVFIPPIVGGLTAFYKRNYLK